MLSSYNQLSNYEKLSILRAFFSLKQNDDFQKITEFLGICDDEVARNLRTLPIELLQIEQGKAQVLTDLFELLETANETNIKILLNTQ